MKRLFLMLICCSIFVFGVNLNAQITCGGPLFLTGDDADDHGNTGIYADIFDEIMANVTNGQTGILAVGVKAFTTSHSWINSVSAAMTSPQVITLVSGANISTVNFNEYAIVFIPSDGANVTDGITQAENDLLVARAGAIATFINSGGGLFSNTQGDLTNPYEFLSGVGGITMRHIPPSGAIPGTSTLLTNVEPTATGASLGITTSNLDHCCFHNTFLTYPSFLEILATANHPGTVVDDEATIIGGATVCVSGNCPLSQGFWKNHVEDWPASALPMMLGTVAYNEQELLDILNMSPRGDASIILAKQLIATKLNIANGSDPTTVSTTITDADALIGAQVIPAGIRTNTADGKLMTDYASILDDYNNGNLTPDCISGTSSKTMAKVISDYGFTLSGNAPNPMNNFTAINYSIPFDAFISIEMYDITGKKIAVLYEGEQQAGLHRIEWNGANKDGRIVPSGIYFYTLRSGDVLLQQKLMIQH